MSSTPQFTTAQLQAARVNAWHQAGEPLLTLDAARGWLASAGILLFAPRPQHIAAPAPSLVEATLGAATEAPTAAQSETARSLVARLVSEGNALPLNLLGGPGDMPDFVVSAQMFSFIFTLRGDKAWKQPPATSGTVKVSPLALATYELLAERGALGAPELANELGREVTEAAVLRALNELWTHLRVIPLLQQGDHATLWELTSRRFTKTIKAGINAGQPTALSALVSLYLAQALLATEDEVSAFLSPLAARSRIREVVHGLTAGRQLDPVVLEGKTLLHIPGTLPEFPVVEEPVMEGEATGDESSETPAEDGRIKRFSASPESKARSEFKGRPLRSFGAGEGRASRPPARDDRERRPFRRDAAGSGEKPSFTRPWSEDRKPRREGDASAAPKRPYVRHDRPAGEGFVKREGYSRPDRAPRTDDGGAPKRPYVRRDRPAGEGFVKREGYSRPDRAPRSDDGGAPKRPYVRRDRPAGEGFVKREGASDRGPARRSFGDKPAFRKDRGEGSSARPARFAKDGERKPFVRRDSGDAPERRPRKTFDDGGERKPRFDSGDRKPGGFGAKRPYVRREEGDARPPRAGGFAKRPYTPRGDGEQRPPRAGGFGGKAPAKRTFGDRPAGRPFGGGGDRKPFRSGATDRPARPARHGERSERPRRPSGDRPSRPGAGPGASRGFTKRPSGRVPFGSKPAGFGKRPAAGGQRPPRKPRADAEE